MKNLYMLLVLGTQDSRLHYSDSCTRAHWTSSLFDFERIIVVVEPQ